MLSPEPGHLTPCELAGGDGNPFPQFLFLQFPFQKVPDDRVSQSLPGGWSFDL